MTKVLTFTIQKYICRRFIIRCLISATTILSLILLFSCHGGSTPESSKKKAELCNNAFEEAYSLAKSDSMTLAIRSYKKCISLCEDAEDTVEAKLIQKPVVNAILQLMNAYQTIGKPEECTHYLDSLVARPTPFLRKYCYRDLLCVAAYAKSRTDDMAMAERMMKKSLSMPLVFPSHDRLFRDYANAAAVFFPNPVAQDSVVSYCVKAINEADKSGNVSGKQYVYSMLGLMYKRKGRVKDAVDLMGESVSEAYRRNDMTGVVNGYNDLSELMIYWNLPQMAEDFANKGISIVDSLKKTSYKANPMIVSMVYERKGEALRLMGKSDSAMYYWSKAEGYVKELPYNSGMADLDVIRGELLSKSDSKDSIARARQMLERVVHKATPHNRAKAYYHLATISEKEGDSSLCEQHLDSMYNILNMAESPTYIYGAYEFALSHYLKKGDDKGIRRFSEAFLGEMSNDKDLANSKEATKIVSSFYTEQKNMELQLLAEKVHKQRLYLVIAILFLMALVMVNVYGRREYNLRRRLADEAMDILLHDHLATIDSLEQERKKATLMREELDRIKTEVRQRPDYDAISLLDLAERGNEENFILRFNVIYPSFMSNLRQRVPNIGKREVLFCMLIVMEMDTEKISTLMAVAPRSVNMLRWRLRKKFGLNPDDSLEEAIKSLI